MAASKAGNISPTQKVEFLIALQKGHTVKRACELANVSRRGIYYHRDEDPEFADAWSRALEDGTELLEEEVYSRALDRTDPKSHIMLIFLLKKRNPEFRENYKTETTIKHESTKEFKFSREELDEAVAILENAKTKASPASTPSPPEP